MVPALALVEVHSSGPSTDDQSNPGAGAVMGEEKKIATTRRGELS
jgi:hypothetical protein